MTKAQIRNNMIEQRDKLSKEVKLSLDQSIHAALFATDEYRQCNQIVTYASFRSEIDTWAIIDKAFHDNKHVFLPRVEGKEISFYKISDINDLIRSKFGILEPYPKHILEKNDKKENNLMILPGVAFDIDGNRIGYGAGYYDRYLSSSEEHYFIKIALAYDFQIMEHLPAEEHDIRADILITPSQILHCI